MKSFNKFLDEAGRCWSGFKPVAGKKAYTPGSCVKENVHDDIKKIRQGKPLKKEEIEPIDEKMISVRNISGHVLKVASNFKDVYKKHGYTPVPGTRTEEVEHLDEDGAWTRKEGQSDSGGLNQKGIESYRRENPGSKLSMAVTTKPSKLDPDSKAAKRRKSFCARMGGMKKRLTSAKTANDPDSRINKSLRKWNC
jgi:hypothetical protein